MKSSCLAKNKLHLNKTGNSIFAKNAISILKRVWSSTKHVERLNKASFIDASTTTPEYEENINVTLKHLQHSHFNKIIVSYLNINSIRKMFSNLDEIVDGNIGILLQQKRNYMNLFPIISSL